MCMCCAEGLLQMWTRLCYSLDSLTNFHYTPKPPTAEMETRTNVASVAMEEAIPMAISDAMQLAPEEVACRVLQMYSSFSGTRRCSNKSSTQATSTTKVTSTCTLEMVVLIVLWATGEDELTPAERKSRRNAKKKRGAKSRIAQGAGRKHRLELDKAGENQLNVVTAAPGIQRATKGSLECGCRWWQEHVEFQEVLQGPQRQCQQAGSQKGQEEDRQTCYTLQIVECLLWCSNYSFKLVLINLVEVILVNQVPLLVNLVEIILVNQVPFN